MQLLLEAGKVLNISGITLAMRATELDSWLRCACIMHGACIDSFFKNITKRDT